MITAPLSFDSPGSSRSATLSMSSPRLTVSSRSWTQTSLPPPAAAA